MSVKIRHVDVRALVDTGAFSSCVSLSLIKRLKLESKIIPVSQRKRLFTPDGKTMHVVGTIQLTLDIQELKIHVNFYVVPCLQFDVILGVDFLDKPRPKLIWIHKL